MVAKPSLACIVTECSGLGVLENARSLLHQLWAFLSTRVLSTPIPSTRVYRV